MPTDLFTFVADDDDACLSDNRNKRRLYPDQVVYDVLVQIGREGSVPKKSPPAESEGASSGQSVFSRQPGVLGKAFRPKNLDIEWLVRGYVMVGAQMNWPTPSMYPLIPLFRILYILMPRGKFDELVAWVVGHTHHRLVPFGRETRA